MSNGNPASPAKKKVVFLYQELAGYIVSCLEHFVNQFPVELDVIRYEVNSVAPFEFTVPQNTRFHNRKDFTGLSLESFLKELKPDLVFLGGWRDRAYLQAIRSLPASVIRVMTMDNHWQGTARQHFLTFLSKGFFRTHIDYLWIPGMPQYEFARRLGFPAGRIRLGFYSCDYALFSRAYDKAHLHRNQFKRRFVFAGRFTEEKGVDLLVEAFTQCQSAAMDNWELVFLGKGPLEQSIPSHPRIKVEPFRQPASLAEFSEDGGVFVLPSNYEAWGVVVHEFASAGYPLICSWHVGAATQFLRNGYNGFYFPTGNAQALMRIMCKIAALPDDELFRMGQRSHALAAGISPETWSAELWEMISGGSAR